jgi:DNA-binding LacI/PurR family transcriptional regulator
MAQMRQVATKAGVSLATVSHVLNHTRYVAPETVNRVLHAARELNYYQNIHARRLAQSRSDLVGFVLSEIANPFFGEIINSFEKAASERGFDVLLCNTEYSPARIGAIMRKLITNKVWGAAVMTSTLEASAVKELVAQGIAVVLHNQGYVHKYISDIRVDYLESISRAVDHLLAQGHRSFAIICGPPTIRSAAVVRDAFVKVLAARGLQAGETVESNYKADGGASAVRSLLARRPLPTALLCGNDLIAVGAMSVLEEAGVRVPEDISVLGCDDIFFSRLSRPPLTTIHVPREKLGKLAFEALERIRKSKSGRGRRYLIETQLVVRKSTGPQMAELNSQAGICSAPSLVRD